jgi:hypothetical protein
VHEKSKGAAVGMGACACRKVRVLVGAGEAYVLAV